MLKTQLAILSGLKAIRLGSAIGDVKIGEIDYDLKNIAVVKDSKVDKKALAERGRTAYESARRITGYFAELDIAQTELKNEQAQTEINRKKALETIIAKESAEDDKKATEYGLQNVTLASGGADDFNTDVKRENLERLKKLHKASPFKYQRTKNDTRTDDEIDAASLKKFLRELQGNHDFDLNAEDLTVDYNATYFSLEELEKLCEDPTEEHVMEFMRPLIEFDPVKVLEGIDLNAVTNELSSRDRLQRELLRRTQKPLMLKQFAEDLVVKNGILSDASLALFDKACHKFLAFTGIVGRLTTPVQFSLTEFKELEIPGLKNLADCVDHMEEFEAETRKSGEEFEEKHPATQFFADEELVKGIKMQGLKKYRAGFMGGKFSMGAHNKSGIDMISLPVSKEEMKKILDKDTEYLKSLEKVVRKLSLIDETGRPRLLGNEEEADLIAYGKKDLLYFAELSRAASIMRIAQGFDPKWVEETLGTSYNALMQNCKAIATIFEALSQKMTTPKTEMYQMRDTYKSAKIKMTEIEEVRLSEKTAFDKKMADKIRGTY